MKSFQLELRTRSFCAKLAKPAIATALAFSFLLSPNMAAASSPSVRDEAGWRECVNAFYALYDAQRDLVYAVARQTGYIDSAWLSQINREWSRNFATCHRMYLI
jgi:hypothetical protein